MGGARNLLSAFQHGINGRLEKLSRRRSRMPPARTAEDAMLAALAPWPSNALESEDRTNRRWQ